MIQQKIDDLKEAIEVLEDGGYEYAARVLKEKLYELEKQLADPAAL